MIFPYEDPATPAAPGLLLLGDTTEYFCSSLLWKGVKEIMNRNGGMPSRRLLTDRDRSALIHHFATHLEWWPIYAQEEIVSVQDHLLFAIS